MGSSGCARGCAWHSGRRHHGQISPTHVPASTPTESLDPQPLPGACGFLARTAGNRGLPRPAHPEATRQAGTPEAAGSCLLPAGRAGQVHR